MATVGVLGAGSWGTTLADLLARSGHSVRVWAHDPAAAAEISRRRENVEYLKGVRLADELEVCSDLELTLRERDVIVMAVPSHAAREVLSKAAGWVREGQLVVSATKGIELETLRFMSGVAADVLPRHRFVALSGPSFAREVAEGQPTAVVAASPDREAAHLTQQLFATPKFRVYSNLDIVGTELAASLKNVVAIAAGILEGLEMGHNPRAALITRGLAEITRLGLTLGAHPSTFAGLAGMGDLVLTCSGSLSRNRSLGVALGRGQSLDDYRKSQRGVAEGVNTAAAAVRLGRQCRVELPIAEQVADVLFHQKTPRQSIAELMERAPKPEQWI